MLVLYTLSRILYPLLYYLLRPLFVEAVIHLDFLTSVHACIWRGPLKSTNTKSLAKESSKILIFEYFRHLTMGLDVFFDADSESPRMT